MFNLYDKYPFKIPLRTKVINVFRYFFKWRLLEHFLLERLVTSPDSWWQRCVPPLYLYGEGSIRKVTRENLNFVLDLSRMLDHSIYFYALRDVAWLNLFRQIEHDYFIIDAGANIGYLSLKFARLSPNGFVYSFEPDTDNFSQLCANVNANKFANLKIFKNALGEKPDQRRLYKLYAFNPGANRILASSDDLSCPSEIVDVTTLDLFEEREKPRRIDLIKIDVEGFELFVLRGGRNLIQHWKPVLFVELVDQNLQQQNCSAESLVSYIESIGYVVNDAKTMTPINKSNLTRHTDIICYPV